MTEVIWSWDDGYGDNKGTNGAKNYLVPSYVTLWRQPPTAELTPGGKTNADPYAYISVTYDGKKYLVGQGAINQDSNGAWIGGMNKHADRNFPVLLATFLGLMAEDYETERVVVDVLSMGLPIDAYKLPERHELLQKLVIEKPWHVVEIELYNGKKFKREINVKELLIKEQPFGSLCDVFLDDKGDIKDKKIPQQFNLVADLGARTFNMYGINGLEPFADLIDQTLDGMFEAYKLVGKELETQRGGKIQDIKLPSIVQSGEFLDASGETLDITDVREWAYDVHANKVANIVLTKAATMLPFINRIIWTGGGAEVLQSRLEAYMEGRNPVFLGRYSTAIGLWKFAVRYNRSKVPAAPVVAAAPKIKARIGSSETTV